MHRAFEFLTAASVRDLDKLFSHLMRRVEESRREIRKMLDSLAALEVRVSSTAGVLLDGWWSALWAGIPGGARPACVDGPRRPLPHAGHMDYG